MLLAVVSVGAAVAFSTSARGQEIWRLDNLTKIARHETTIVGHPRLVEVDGMKAVAFDGAHDGLFVSAIPIAGAKAFTIEVLIAPDGGPEAQRFFHLQDANGRRALIELRTDGKTNWWLDAFLYPKVEDSNRGLTLIDPKRVHPLGHWYWVAMRYDGRHMADFVNGVKELEGELEFAPFVDGKVSIGVRQNLVYWFKGAIREIRFHREALPEAKLQVFAPPKP